MPKFIYTALAKGGKTIKGSAEASSKEAVIAALKRQNLHPVLVKKKNKINLNISARGKSVKLKDLVVFTRQLSTMISAGVPLNRALTTLKEQTNDKYFESVIEGVAKDVESGMPMADAFAKYPNVFSDIYVNMVRAGEAGGILDKILKRLSTQVEKEASMKKKNKKCNDVPDSNWYCHNSCLFGIMIFIMPKITKIINDLTPDASLPVYSQIMMGISDFTRQYAYLIIPAIFIILFAIYKYIHTPSGKIKYHLLLLKIPILKNVVIKMAIARFARTFASLMSAGVGVLEALDVTGGSIGNKIIEQELKDAAKEVKNGKQLSEPLSHSKYFPPIVAQMLAIGEESGQIDTVLLKVADFYEEEVDTLIDGMSSLIEPLMIIVLGSIVGIIAASVMGPISSLSKNIGI
jgi:type IV pilus assembly protein PilC